MGMTVEDGGGQILWRRPWEEGMCEWRGREHLGGGGDNEGVHGTEYGYGRFEMRRCRADYTVKLYQMQQDRDFPLIHGYYTLHGRVYYGYW